jgi:hypothetical protein
VRQTEFPLNVVVPDKFHPIERNDAALEEVAQFECLAAMRSPDEANAGSARRLIFRHEEAFPELASLRPAITEGDTILDEAFPLLHLQALRGLQPCVDILAGARKTLAKYRGVVSGFRRGASGVRSHDKRCVAHQHDAAKDRPGDADVNDSLHEGVACRGYQLGELGMDLALCARP